MLAGRKPIAIGSAHQMVIVSKHGSPPSSRKIGNGRKYGKEDEMRKKEIMWEERESSELLKEALQELRSPFHHLP
jgi:hypothetical protein